LTTACISCFAAPKQFVVCREGIPLQNINGPPLQSSVS
jgi:hypothetical protein